MRTAGIIQHPSVVGAVQRAFRRSRCFVFWWVLREQVPILSGRLTIKARRAVPSEMALSYPRWLLSGKNLHGRARECIDAHQLFPVIEVEVETASMH
jgi:hypothetical protein